MSPVAVTPESRPARAAEPLDDADRRILASLAQDGRRAVRSIAREVGLSEATVGARVRSLSERRLLGVTAVLDWRAAGYAWDLWVEIEAPDGSRRELGARLRAVPGAHSVQRTFGGPDWMVHALAEGPAEASAFVDAVAALDGVESVRGAVVTETVKYVAHFAPASARRGDLVVPAPRIALDDTDRAVVEHLVADGRRSFRDIARAVDRSEATVRARVHQMEDAGLLRIIGQSDPYLTGAVGAWAFVLVRSRAGRAAAAARAVAALDDALLVQRMIGGHDVLAFVASRDRARLIRSVGELRGDESIRSMRIHEVTATDGFDFRWVRLVDPTPGTSGSAR